MIQEAKVGNPGGGRPHSCLNHLEYRRSNSVETHGLDCGPYEHTYSEWWECRVCKEVFTEEEVALSGGTGDYRN